MSEGVCVCVYMHQVFLRLCTWIFVFVCFLYNGCFYMCYAEQKSEFIYREFFASCLCLSECLLSGSVHCNCASYVSVGLSACMSVCWPLCVSVINTHILYERMPCNVI